MSNICRFLMIASVFLLLPFVQFGANNSEDNHSAIEKGTMHFTENIGQWGHGIQYKCDIPSGVLFLLQDKLVYNFIKAEDARKHHDLSTHTEAHFDDQKIHFHAYEVVFPNINLNSDIRAVNKQAFYKNYFVGNDKMKWKGNVGTFLDVWYDNVFNQVDLHLSAANNTLKYDFVVHPGGSLNDIVLQYNYVDQLAVNNGDLSIQTSVNEIIEKKPFAYQVVDGQQIEIRCRYKLEDGAVSFELLEDYDPSIDLIIDPEVSIATFSGGTGSTYGYCATYAEDGMMYAAGKPFDMGFPTTLGAYDLTYDNALADGDAGIIKYSADGTQLVFATYIGGNHVEEPFSMIINEANDLIIFGVTASRNFPTTSEAYDTTYNFNNNGGGLDTDEDIFVSVLKSDGTDLMASTLIGGDSIDGYASESYGLCGIDSKRGQVDLDSLGNIVILSSTKSSDFPVMNALQDTLSSSTSGELDICLFKLTSNLDTLIWSTYLGGEGADAGYGLYIDDADNILITGETRSTNFPSTLGAYEENSFGGADAFVAKIKGDGSSIIAASYIGTSASDAGYFVDVDQNGLVYVLGNTNSDDFYPVSSCRYFEASGGTFLHVLNADLSSTQYTSRIGSYWDGGDWITPTAFRVDNCGKIFFAGFGNVSDLPVTPDALQSECGDPFCVDFYLAVYSPGMKKLNYATYFGGDAEEFGFEEEHIDGGSSRFDKDGNIYHAFCSPADILPTNSDAWTTTNQSPSYDVVALKMYVEDVNTVEGHINITPNDTGCVPFSVDFSDQEACDYKYTWVFDDEVVDDLMVSKTFDSRGDYTVTLIVQDTTLLQCNQPDTSEITIVAQQQDPFTISDDTTICLGDTAKLLTTADSGSFYWSSEEEMTDTLSTEIEVFPRVTTTFYAISTQAFCPANTVETIVFVDDAQMDLCCTDTIAKGSSIELVASEFESIIWDPVDPLDCSCSVINVQPESTTTYYVTGISENGCISQDSVVIYVVYEALGLPTTFTPNGNGLNDSYEVFIQGYKQANYLKIYNRWGDVVFKTENPLNERWDGKLKGKSQPIGSYTVELSITNQSDESRVVSQPIILIR